MFLEDVCDFFLLLFSAVEFEGDDDGVLIDDKAVVLNGLYDLFELDFAGEGVSVGDNGLAVVAVPHVDLNAATALGKGIYIGLTGGLSSDLIFKQIGVVGRTNVIRSQRLVHILVDLHFVRTHQLV